jgi:hypothetical protein
MLAINLSTLAISNNLFMAQYAILFKVTSLLAVKAPR